MTWYEIIDLSLKAAGVLILLLNLRSLTALVNIVNYMRVFK